MDSGEVRLSDIIHRLRSRSTLSGEKISTYTSLNGGVGSRSPLSTSPLAGRLIYPTLSETTQKIDVLSLWGTIEKFGGTPQKIETTQTIDVFRLFSSSIQRIPRSTEGCTPPQIEFGATLQEGIPPQIEGIEEFDVTPRTPQKIEGSQKEFDGTPKIEKFDGTPKIEEFDGTPKEIEIDGGRYLCIGGSGADDYYLSDQPQLIKGQRINVKFKGLRVFQIDSGDADYFDLVTLGIFMWNADYDHYVSDYDDFGNVWVSGDEKLFDTLRRHYDCKLHRDDEMIFLPPLVFKYPRNPESRPSKWTLERFLVVFINHTMRLCAEMRNAAGLSGTTREKRTVILFLSIPLGIHPSSAIFSDSDTENEYDADTTKFERFVRRQYSGRYSHGGLQFHRNVNFTDGLHNDNGYLELPGKRYLAMDKASGKYRISDAPQQIELGERIPSTFLSVCMFRIDRGEWYDLVSLAMIGCCYGDNPECVCGDETLFMDVSAYKRHKKRIKLMAEFQRVYLPPFVVKYPKDKRPTYWTGAKRWRALLKKIKN